MSESKGEFFSLEWELNNATKQLSFSTVAQYADYAGLPKPAKPRQETKTWRPIPKVSTCWE